MTTFKMALAMMMSATMASAMLGCSGEGDDLDEGIDSVESAIDANLRGDERVRWEDDRRPCRACRPDGAREFRGCVTLRRFQDDRRVLQWLDDREIDKASCHRRAEERDRDGLAYYR